MRFRVTLATERGNGGPPPVIRFDYQHAIGSMFYDRLIRARSEYKALHDSKGFKFFTFSRLEIPRRRVTSEGLAILSNDAYLWFSSIDSQIVRILAGQMLREPHVQIAGVNFRAVNITLMPSITVNGNSERFVTMSPIILRTRIENNGRMRTWDLSPDDDRFEDALVRNLERKYSEYYGRKPDGTIEIVDIGRTRQKRITIQENYHRAHLMEIEMKGDPMLMEFGHECGLGEKNSMGFGMIKRS